MKRPVCATCQVTMETLAVGVKVVELDNDGIPYQVWSADTHQCPICSLSTATFFSKKAVLFATMTDEELKRLVADIALGRVIFEYPNKNAVLGSLESSALYIADLFKKSLTGD